MSGNDMPNTERLIEGCTHCGAPIDVTAAMPIQAMNCPTCGQETKVRSKLENYLVESVLGSGGMGVVYKAFDINLERHVALKVIRQDLCADAEHIQQFEEEAKLTALVIHPNVVRVFSFGSDHGLLFIAMELVEHGTLNDLMELQGKIAEIQVLEIGIQIAKGLQAASQSGLLHRDVKPGNILFVNGHTARIVDFGLAQFLSQEVQVGDVVWGSSYYIPPERVDRKPEDFRSDIYALGATLFHAIAGRPAHEAEDATQVALKHVNSNAVSLQTFAPDVHSSTAFVINRMLQRNPEDRYQSYEELIEHLTFAYDQLRSRPAGAVKSKERLVVDEDDNKQGSIWLAISVLAVTLAIAIGIYVYIGLPSTGSPGRKVEKKYQRARELILKGDYCTAEKEMAAVCSAVDLPQPEGRWALMHWGMAALLGGKDDEARRIFQELYKQGMFSQASEHITLANFFVEAGRIGADPKPVSPGMAKVYSKTNCEALGLFIFGAKNVRLGKPDEARVLLEAFASSSPKAPYGWIGDYKPIARKMLEQIALQGNASVKSQNL